MYCFCLCSDRYDYAISLLPTQYIKKFTSLTAFQKWMSGPAAKVVLFTNKGGASSPLYQALSAAYHPPKKAITTTIPDVQFAEIKHTEKDIVGQYSDFLPEYPSLLFFPATDAATAAPTARRYPGAIDLRHIRIWINEQLGIDDEAGTEEADEVPEIHDQSCFDRYCAGNSAKSLCVLLVTPQTASKKEMKAQRQVLKDVASIRADSLFSYGIPNCHIPLVDIACQNVLSLFDDYSLA